MKITLILIGKTDSKMYQAAIDDYVSRINHYLPFDIQVIPDVKNSKNLSEQQQKQKEGEAILRLLSPSDTVILLDERGKEFRSVEYAAWIEKKQQTAKRLTFVIGGPYGFAKEVYDRANEKISLSKMTFSHQMVRLIFTEQLYRACTIIKGEPYHHDSLGFKVKGFKV
ncbi:MAG: 23S rRNA (pseudouridine(1915)-N(3))-methyltransferase RlmH [Bacteroidaceae bacterium]|nr:23S rRNA (pseudouridine(1915)-N(3))-methyltransferase RlmH [Bacteroidaceae bacterium]